MKCEDRVLMEVKQNIDSVRNEIRNKFDKIEKLLLKRKFELDSQLDEIEQNFEKEYNVRKIILKNLTKERSYTDSKLGGSEMLKSLKTEILKKIDIKSNEIRLNSSAPHVSLFWNEDVENVVKNLGSIEVIRYQHKINPVYTTSRVGNRNGKMEYPQGLAIDSRSSKIFIADKNNDRIQVLNHQGQYLYKFGENGAGKLNYPYGITIWNDKVYVSQWRGNIFIFELNGEFIEEFGNNELSDPRGIAVSENSGDIYVCDLNKNMIFVYSQNLKYKTSFGKSKLNSPRDIKLTQDRIFVLDDGNPCIHIFNRDLSYSHSIVSRGIGNAVGYGWFFTLDHEENILISDYYRDIISVFSQRGQLIHQIGSGSDIYQPEGIAIDSINRIAVVDDKQEGSLKIF